MRGRRANELAYGGQWQVERERILAGRSARLRLHFHARNVFLVLGGHGRIDVLVDRRPQPQIKVAGISRLYTILRYASVRDGILELRFTPGISAYAFTFG